jgi:hypothetical protein
MTTIKTRWITSQYDPSMAQQIPTTQEGRQHIVYAAMLDGVRGRTGLSAHTGFMRDCVVNCLLDLRDAGYIKLSANVTGIATYEVIE